MHNNINMCAMRIRHLSSSCRASVTSTRPLSTRPTTSRQRQQPQQYKRRVGSPSTHRPKRARNERLSCACQHTQHSALLQRERKQYRPSGKLKAVCRRDFHPELKRADSESEKLAKEGEGHMFHISEAKQSSRGKPVNMLKYIVSLFTRVV